jgi:hypothetical protein
MCYKPHPAAFAGVASEIIVILKTKGTYMPTFDIVIIIAALTGAFMVVGSIVLLAKGAISLKDLSSASELKIGKEFVFSTPVPALMLFVIGLGSILYSAHLSKPLVLKPVTIIGEIQGVENPSDIKVKTSMGNWPVTPASDGKIATEITPTLKELHVTAEGPGYENSVIKDIQISSGKAVFIISGLKKVADKPSRESYKIDAPQVPITPLTDKGDF